MNQSNKYPRMAKLNRLEKLIQRCEELGIDLPTTEENQPLDQYGRALNTNAGKIGNRFCILPMEGWDGTRDGKPTDLTIRRWRNFGTSGAKLIWGGEAVAVRHDGRANPNQLVINESNLKEIAALRNVLFDAHQSSFSSTDDLSVGLQLTHSGRFARPNEHSRLEPKSLYRHPVLDHRFNIDETAILTDDELWQLIEDFASAARLAEKAGFAWVDIKHCHGYLGHELLSAYDREGTFGGSFENRTRFLREIVNRVQDQTDLAIGVRLSAFDFMPYEPGDDGVGVPSIEVGSCPAFGVGDAEDDFDLEEPIQFVRLLHQLGIDLLCTTAGSPYYNPHIQRPATFPPSDGYQPPEDPLVGVARQIKATKLIKMACPEMTIVGSGYSYLQDWLANVGNGVLKNGWCDSIGLGRMFLSYPDLPADVLMNRPSKRKKICRTFSDCTTAPRNGMISGCYPLDEFYKELPEADRLKAMKREQ